MKSYDVTIAIPVYNVARHIRLTMESALAQTLPGIEFLVCDDCGTDGSMDIVRQYQQEHPRGADIRIVSQPRNMGIGAARNRMMAEARGRYFFSLDADDALKGPTAIELLFTTAEQHRAEIVYGSHERLHTRDGAIERVESCHYERAVFTEPDDYAGYVYNVGIQVMNWNYLVLTDVLRRNHLQVAPVGHGYGEDFTFTVDLPTYITRAVLLPDITYQYYIREDFHERRRKLMNREQMDLAIAAIDEKKRRTHLSSRPYYARRVATLLMYDHSFACQIIARRSEPTPRYTDAEIRRIMWHPMSLSEILSSRQARTANLKAWLAGHLPPALCVLSIRLSMMLARR